MMRNSSRSAMPQEESGANAVGKENSIPELEE